MKDPSDSDTVTALIEELEKKVNPYYVSVENKVE